MKTVRNKYEFHSRQERVTFTFLLLTILAGLPRERGLISKGIRIFSTEVHGAVTYVSDT